MGSFSERQNFAVSDRNCCHTIDSQLGLSLENITTIKRNIAIKLPTNVAREIGISP